MKNLNFGVITTLVVVGILITTTFTSCKKLTEVKPEKFTIRVIDSCEYIEYSNGFVNSEVYAITHKGNCKYCRLRNGK